MQNVMTDGTIAAWIVDRMTSRAVRDRTWGSLDVWPEPYGIVRYRLTVHPPGTDVETRRWLRLLDQWPGVGVPCAAFAAMSLTLAAPPALAVSASTLLYLAGWIAIHHRVSRTRRMTRRLIATDFGDRSRAEERDECARLARLASTMMDADRAMHAGLISPVQQELVWAQVFNDIEARRVRAWPPE